MKKYKKKHKIPFPPVGTLLTRFAQLKQTSVIPNTLQISSLYWLLWPQSSTTPFSI